MLICRVDLDESLSGSDSSYSGSSDEEDGDNNPKRQDTTLNALLKKQAGLSGVEPDLDSAPERKTSKIGNSPLLWLQSSALPSDCALGIYRSLFTTEERALGSSELVQVITAKQLPTKPATNTKDSNTEKDGGVPLPLSIGTLPQSTSEPHIFLCMIGGGHFAAMIVSLRPQVVRRNGLADEKSANVIAHKTFHRYTTRRKQGGSQSANDNSKGNAHSAGSSLRRYNETALTNDVRNLLFEWRSWLNTADLLFIRATGTTNRRTLFGPYEGQVLKANDKRIRSFTFSTRRATQSELMKSFVELTRVKIASVEDLLRVQQKEAERATKAKPDVLKDPTPSKTNTPKYTREEEELILHGAQIHALIRRGKAPALTSYLSTNNLSPDFEFFSKDGNENYHAPRPLFLAASLNNVACVSALLLKARSDPTIRNAEGKTAYEIAGDRATRDAFRLARSELGEDIIDWENACVGSAISKEDVDQRVAQEKADALESENKEQQRRQAELDRLRQADNDREEAQRDKKFGKGKVVSISGPQKIMSAEERREEEAKGMTPEMKMRLEREKRARAAEARLKGR